VGEGDVPEISPEQASKNGGYVRDDELPMLAATWLAEGYDSEELRELAGMTRQQSREGGRRLLSGVLSSLGWPLRGNSPEEIPWLGYWYQIEWAQVQMDRLLSPYVAAQEILDVASDVPDLWRPAGGERLVSLLRAWDEDQPQRKQIGNQIREHVLSLREDDVPPLIGRG
jgi:hypothetical protein